MNIVGRPTLAVDGWAVTFGTAARRDWAPTQVLAGPSVVIMSINSNV